MDSNLKHRFHFNSTYIKATDISVAFDFEKDTTWVQKPQQSELEYERLLPII